MNAPSKCALWALALPLAFAPVAQAQDFVAVDWTGTLYVLDGSTGCVSQTLTVNALTEINAMARRPSDGRLFVAGVWTVGLQPTLNELDPATGAVLNTVPLTGIDSVRGMAFSPSGELYVVDDQGYTLPDDLWKVDENTGNGSLVGPMGNFIGVQALCWDPAGSRLLAWDVGPGGCLGAGLIHVNPATAASLDPDPVCGVTGNCWDVQGLTVDSNGQLWGVGEYLTQIDSATGCITWWGTCLLNYLRGVEPWGDFSLQKVGTCPTAASVMVTGGTPLAAVGLGYSQNTGGSVVPSGGCVGTAIDLGPNVQVAGIRSMNSTGSATFGPRPVPAGACGMLWLQAVDLGSCKVSNLLQL